MRPSPLNFIHNLSTTKKQVSPADLLPNVSLLHASPVFERPWNYYFRTVSCALLKMRQILTWKCTCSGRTTQTPIPCAPFPCAFQVSLCSWIFLGRPGSAQLCHFLGGLQCVGSKWNLLRNNGDTRDRDRGWIQAPTLCVSSGLAWLGISSGNGCKWIFCFESPE